MRKRKIMAGEILTLSLLKRIDKAAYQYGGLDVEGESNFKVENGKAIRTIPTAIISKKHIKGSVEKFAKDFAKTMNASIYNLRIV